MENDYERTRSFSDSYISHDTMGEINDPFYFHQFIAAAQNEKLQYVGDAVFHSMIANNVTTQGINLIKSVGSDIIATEQCLDFINNRLFRSTLLCHEHIELTRGFNPEILKQFHFAAPLKLHPHNADLLTNTKISFQPINGPTLSTPDPIAKILLSYLSMEWPRSVSFTEITGYLQRTLKSESKELATQALQYLWRSYTLGLLKLYVHPLPITNQVSAKPKTTALVRYQAEQRYPCLTNQLHEEIPITPLQHHLLPLLDGEHDHEALLTKMVELVKLKKLTLQQGSAQITDSAKLKLALRETLDNTLNDWARLGLLVG
jgi:methyltransferase-like protein